MRNTKPVLLVEDDAIDTMTVRRAFRDLRLSNPLAHATNGEEALEYLTNEENPCPCVILLDLNMPRMNGVEFMRVIKADPSMRKIPVISSSPWTTRSSSRPSRRSMSTGQSANCLRNNWKRNAWGVAPMHKLVYGEHRQRGGEESVFIPGNLVSQSVRRF